MNVVVVPGIHSPQITHEFIQSLDPLLEEALVIPSQSVPVYSPQHVFMFLHERYNPLIAQQPKSCREDQALLFISFSAGVVGGLGAARQWQAQVGPVKALIAFDGWGVLFRGSFPIHRVSHDYWTHWSSGLTGTTQSSFYANPSVDHLDLWRSPHTTSGIRTDSQSSPAQASETADEETAATFVRSLIEHYRESP